MDTILKKFQYRNKKILLTLKKTPDTYWEYHIMFCRSKHKKMAELDAAMEDLQQKMYMYEKNKHTYDIRKQESIKRSFVNLNFVLQGDIEYFNKTMVLPVISIERVKPKLTDVLRYSRESMKVKVNPVI